MKYFLNFFAFSVLFLWSCESPKKDEIVHHKNQSKVKKSKEVKVKVKKKKKKVLLPNSENAESFFRKYGGENPENIVVINTSYGRIKLKLYNDTPIHRAAFVYLIKKKYFDETLFYRVSKRFVIQGGNTNDNSVEEKRKKIGNFRLPQEISSNHFHQTGVLAATKEYENNPNNLSNPFNFYIVVGPKLNSKSVIYNDKIPEERKSVYIENGGAYHLDGLHTVFGEVIEGMDVVYKINQVDVDQQEWPIEDIKMTVEIIK